MKKNMLLVILTVLVSLIPLAYLGLIYGRLPDSVPTHFGWQGKADSYGSKSYLPFACGAMAVLAIGLYFLVTNLGRIDPKKTAKQSPETFRKIGFAVVLLFAALNITIIYASEYGAFTLHILFPLLGLFFTYIGNLMHSIKPNYFVGIRVPWTLEDPSNWRATHQLGGKLWFIGGIMITVLTLVLPEKAADACFIIIMATIVVVPIIYSYMYFKKNAPQP
jgi:uncharacterized membrane protein